MDLHPWMSWQDRSPHATQRIVRGAALICVLALGASGCSAAGRNASAGSASTTQVKVQTRTQTATPTTPPASGPTTTTPVTSTRPGTVTKVLVFVEENHSLRQMKAEMPYAFGLARQYGYATGYAAITHPSLPNYVAIAGGQTYGITNDDPPEANPVHGQSVFGQAVASGQSAAVYADGMPQNCLTSNGGDSYAVKHNPWAYFVNSGERSACQQYDVPVDRLGAAIAQGRLPSAGMVIPNLCHDAHDCSLSTADTWFRGWMTRIFQGPDWKSGHLAVVLTADEDDGSRANTANTVLTVVIHPSQKAHVVAAALSHYSLTRLYEEVAGMPYLSGAASAPSMATAFGLPLR